MRESSSCVMSSSFKIALIRFTQTTCNIISVVSVGRIYRNIYQINNVTFGVIINVRVYIKLILGLIV